MTFEKFNQWVLENFGIQLDAYKEGQMQRRITNIMLTSGAKDLKAYSELLAYDQKAKQAFLEHITINVTEFYRNKVIFDGFSKILTQQIFPQFSKPKIWSAACSVGAEPYSIALVLEKNQLTAPKILATDIDHSILKQAQAGIYRATELKNVSKQELAQFFTLNSEGYQVKPIVKNRVLFKRHDLLRDPYEKQHVIVCRNVTIYFKPEARDAVYQKFSDSLVKGGILFTGATETIPFSEQFGLKKIDSFVYQKM